MRTEEEKIRHLEWCKEQLELIREQAQQESKSNIDLQIKFSQPLKKAKQAKQDKVKTAPGKKGWPKGVKRGARPTEQNNKLKETIKTRKEKNLPIGRPKGSKQSKEERAKRSATLRNKVVNGENVGRPKKLITLKQQRALDKYLW